MRFASALAMTLGVCSGSASRQQITSDGRIVVQDSPDVDLGIDDDLCIFKNGWDQWCFSTITPMARLGIEWDQTYDQTDRNTTPVVDYWQLEMKLFGDFQGYLKMLFHIEKLVSIDNIFDLEQFKAALIFSMIINENW